MSAAELSVVAPLWQDRPAAENVEIGRLADELGYRELWIGEMATYDSFALGTAIGQSTEQIALSMGPFAVAVRTPITVAVGAASVADLIGRDVGVALGTSSDVVVSKWHGRDRRRPATSLDEHAAITRTLLGGERADFAGDVVSSSGYQLRLPPVRGPLSIAAFGPRALRIAATRGDRLLLNMLTPALAGRLAADYRAAAAAAGNDRPRVAIWLATAIDPTAETYAQIARGKVAYLAAPGYRDMFAEAGFGELTNLARNGAHPRELLAAMPHELVDAVGLVGTADRVAARIADYRAAGIDDICLVPATAGDDTGRRTLSALATLT